MSDEILARDMTTSPCMCTFDLCTHEPGEHCGEQLATVKFMVESEDGPAVVMGICDKCWDTFKKHFPSFVPQVD